MGGGVCMHAMRSNPPEHSFTLPLQMSVVRLGPAPRLVLSCLFFRGSSINYVTVAHRERFDTEKIDKSGGEVGAGLPTHRTINDWRNRFVRNEKCLVAGGPGGRSGTVGDLKGSSGKPAWREPARPGQKGISRTDVATEVPRGAAVQGW